MGNFILCNEFLISKIMAVSLCIAVIAMLVYEGVSMCHGNVGLIKTNALSLRTLICTVA